MILLVKLARLFLEPTSALLISGVFWLGTSFASTTGTTLWSHDFAAIFSLAAIYVVLKATREGKTNYWPIISILLFSAYLCRPTLALLAPFVLLFLFTYNRLAAIKSALLVAFLLGCFMVFSLHEFHQLLPDYYMQQQPFGGDHFFEGLYGNLLSPSRGLLIYSPFILLTWLCVGVSWKKWNLKRSWLLIGLAWPVVHILLISSWSVWWGGNSFGPRLLTDILPGLFLLTIYAWPVAIRGVLGKSAVAILALSIVFSVFVNSYQGLFNQYTVDWNDLPLVGRDSHTLFNWSFPQFLHTKERSEKRFVQLCAMYCSPILPSEALSFASDKVRFIDWSFAEDTHRWSSGTSSSIVFRLDRPAGEFEGELSLTAGSLGRQRINVFLNDAEIFGGQIDSWGETVDVPFSPTLLQDGLNTIRFDLPDARQPESGDSRVLALALISFSLR